MTLIKCRECGKEISSQAKVCPNCGCQVHSGTPPMNFNQPVLNNNKTSGLSIAALVFSILGITFFIGAILSIIDLCKKDGRKKTCSIIALVISGIWFISVVGNMGSSNNDSDIATTQQVTEQQVNVSIEQNVTNESEEIESEEVTTELAISEEEFKASCQVFDYKTIARNPDDYIGQNFVVDVKIFQSVNGKWYSDYDKYYKAYTNDEYDLWLGDFLYVIDCQDKDSDSYLNVLEDDIIRIYGSFNGMTESKNSLTGTSNDEISLDMYYCELISE